VAERTVQTFRWCWVLNRRANLSVVMVTVLSLELMRRAIRFWGACFWQGGEFGCVWSGASVLASWGCWGFSRRVCSLINCKFAGVLPEHSISDSLLRSLRVRWTGVLMRVSLRLTALVRLWCCVYSPEKPGDRPRSSVERTF